MTTIHLAEEQVGAPLPVMDEDAMYEFVGLREEDERAEQARIMLKKRMKLILSLWTYKVQSCWLRIIYLCFMLEKTLQ
jgi:hypothetical protein